MIDQGSVPSLMGSTVRDSSGDKIGKVGQVYLDDTTGLPEWVTVKTGLFGTRESFVPLAAARVEGDELIVDVPKDRVSDAPQIDEDGHLSEEQEHELYRYYGVDPGPFGTGVGPSDGSPGPAGPAGPDTYSDPLVDDGLAEPGPGPVDDLQGPAVGVLERPSHEALPDDGYGAGSDGMDVREYGGSSTTPDPALAPEGDPALDPTLDPALDAELDRASRRDTDVVAAIDPDSPALGGPGSASSTPGEQTATPASAPMTTGEAYEVSRHGDAMTAAEERAGTERVEPGRSRLRRWMAGDS